MIYIFIGLLIIICSILLWQNMLMAFKIGYYEQILKNNKDKFSKEKWLNLIAMFERKSPF